VLEIGERLLRLGEGEDPIHHHLQLFRVDERCEMLNRAIVLAVGVIMLVFGIQNGINDLGSFRMPSLIPLTYYTASVPISGRTLVFESFHTNSSQRPPSSLENTARAL